MKEIFERGGGGEEKEEERPERGRERGASMRIAETIEQIWNIVDKMIETAQS